MRKCYTNSMNCKDNFMTPPSHSCSTMEVQELCDLPVDNLDALPEYVLTERTTLDETTGKVLHSLTRLPMGRINPSGNLANQFTLDGNNPSLTITSGQPLPAYIANEGSQLVVYLAGSGHPADFLVVGTVGDLLLCQAVGVVNTLGGNDYIGGMQYYLGSQAGTVTTSASQTGQKLFKVLSDTKLLINM